MHKAQTSLEFLIVLAGFFSVLALIVPSTLNLFHASVFALDSKNAENFSQQLLSAIEELGILENGSTKTLSLHPMLEWVVSANNNSITVQVNSEKLEKTKTFNFKTNSDISYFAHSFFSKSAIKLSKQNGRISIENG